MKKISLYTNLKRDYEKMKNSLIDYDLKNIENREELLTLKENLIIINTSVNLDKEEETIEILLENRNKILILESTPKLINAQNWLLLGVHGYGNSMMNDIYLKSAIQTINNGLTWLIPDITMEILSKLNSDSLNQKDVLNQLSKAEQQVAILLKDGLSNTKISEELKLSINTVKSHIKNIYLKLEVKDRFSFINLLNKK
ncbi:LuxR C-terminal-related transcriptional regulator [Aliarcobacter cryaerophilus]|mgnify:FL=1|jgi:DNA-binding NarL/FixJ family response regulator|uniref:LuxR C-terminal-related transcriptional regulator n=3 Tax=Arcobacteraceae TaxID=2808963 RepID=A0AAU0P1U0_9BACT|nr:LuxR C-terminal-related transcriptional regulator [Aliarcobacter cryaerophilus]TXH78244.1 MAG: response regulator transcription factor [Romboutsia sp.]WNL13282.1 LuxR C-terminal-related transcriptional regulator [Arcobacter sp. AZ-2023]WPD02997.1 LuxR C-terminal-related transcriptional regulator [Arcobacter sp. DSM 115972]WPD09768.1 LuxR C-terminal-related transcriptional regulator [Arcobacter sp. DSM 115954]MCT7404910.1 LuxR C-terminal-related transcriptional regulator [Aliarcobacter cryae